jgi:hypothetical protein
MGAAAMMGLMIEEVHQDWSELLLVRGRRHGPIGNGLVQVALGLAMDDIDQPQVLGHSRAGKHIAIVVEDRVEVAWMVAFAGQSLQPDAIGEQQMVERAMQAAEENPGGTAIGFVRHLERRGIESAVCPVIIVGKLPEIINAHGVLSS